MIVNAKVILMRCRYKKNLFGIRMQQISGVNWEFTWAFPVTEKRAANEGFDRERLTAKISFSDDYLGCPYCKSFGYVQCGNCGKLSCYDNRGEFQCTWCGQISNDMRETDEFDLLTGED